MKASVDRFHEAVRVPSSANEGRRSNLYIGNQARMMKASNQRFTLLRIGCLAASVLAATVMAGEKPEYTAAEARKHMGESATVVGMVTCIGNGRHHTDLEMGGCLPATLLWVVVPNDVSGPELDCWKLPGVTIAVTGKIESSEGTPQITIKSTTQIVRRTTLDPNYLISANEKENKRDLNGAIADLDRAIDLTHDPGVYMQRARLKENKGDLAGAIRDYDQMIEQHAELDEAVRASYHDNRAKLKIKSRDFDGAIADATSAIQLNPRFPWHYATRGQANEGKGDFAAAIKDYKMAIQTEPHNSAYKDMLRHAQTEASRNHEQSLNKSELTPESIASAFVHAYSGTDIDALASLYADRIDHTDSGVITNAALRAQAREYFARWPVRQWSLVGPVETISLEAARENIIFSASYEASNPQANKHASGIAKETLILAADSTGAMKIVSQKEQTSKRSSGQSDESNKKTSEPANFETATANSASDAALKQKVLGYWETGRHAYLFKSDGIRYMVDGVPTSHWDIRGGLYYEDGKPYKIATLNDKTFDIAGGDLLKRCSKQGIERLKRLCPDWMKEHE